MHKSKKFKINQLHAVSRTQQGKQREPMLRHSVPHFLPNSGDIACSVVELNAALSLEHKSIYLVISSSILYEESVDILAGQCYLWCGQSVR